MQTQALSSAQGALSRALDTQMFGADLINQTIDRLNTGMMRNVPVVDSTYAMQKQVLSAAYADVGKGTRLDITV